MIVTILFVLAFVLALLASLGIATPRLNLGWAAIACWLLAEVLLRAGVMR